MSKGGSGTAASGAWGYASRFSCPGEGEWSPNGPSPGAEDRELLIPIGRAGSTGLMDPQKLRSRSSTG